MIVDAVSLAGCDLLPNLLLFLDKIEPTSLSVSIDKLFSIKSKASQKDIKLPMAPTSFVNKSPFFDERLSLVIGEFQYAIVHLVEMSSTLQDS